MSRIQIPVLSLFCGCGAMDLGFRMHDFVTVLAIDINEAAVESYNWNSKGHAACVGNLATMTGNDVVKLVREAAPNVRLRGVIGGPPCQSFSVSNVHGREDDPRKELPLRYAEILKALNKEFSLDFFVFENVVGLKSDKHVGQLNKFLMAFEDAGFNVFENALNANTFGVPQNRRRIFVVGINKHLHANLRFNFPVGESPLVTVRNAIETLPTPAFFKRGLTPEEIPHHPNHWTMNPKSKKFLNGSINGGRSFRKLRWDHPSWTVAYGHREIHVHPTGARRISVFEAMLLQGFPSEYELRGNLSQQVEQVSNAVPPALAGAIANAIRLTLYDRVETIQASLLSWFQENRRSFPWRRTNDPYKILIAEKLLQQTAATSQVVATYRKIVKEYPTPNALGKARASKLRRMIAPLGFTYRADELGKLAQKIVNRHKGKVPSELRDLLDLPGVGDYAARAVLSFAYGKDVPIVDTNVARFLYRIFDLTEHFPANPARDKKLINIAADLIPKGKSKDFNLAILDLCASICTARSPNCFACPVQKDCLWNRRTSGKAQANGRRPLPQMLF